MADARPISTAGRSDDPHTYAVASAMTLVVLFWATGPVVTKLITAPPLVGALFRFAFSVPLFFALLLVTGRRLTRSTLIRSSLPGAAFGANMLLVFAALQEATVAVLSVAISLHPAVVLVVAGRWMNERVTLWHVGWTLVGIGGAATVILGAGDEVNSSTLGVIYAMGALVTFTVYFLVSRAARADHDVDPIEWMAGVNVWAVTVLVSPAMLLSSGQDFAEFGGFDWLWLLVLVLATGMGGHVLMSWVHGHMVATRSSLYMLLMHPLAVGLAWPVHDEPVTLIQVVGGVVVLGAVAAVVVRSRSARPVSPTSEEPELRPIVDW